ncbi:MAG: hypothetical protein IKR34_04610 [Candidatus Gastranaerophilales bacterium]|nr:hypothetical protein [Candidatus Gastranaerophilales bacterium]
MIHDILPVNNYKGNNSSTTFDFDFYIDTTSQLKVYHYDSNNIKTLLSLNIDYSVNEVKNKNGSFITFPLQGSSYSVLAENESLSIELSLPIAQETQYNNSSLLNLEALEYSFDYLTRLIQILSRQMSLCVKAEECSEYAPNELIERINTIALQANGILNDVSDYFNNIEDYYEGIATINDRFDTIVQKFNSIDTLAESIESVSQNKANTSLSNISDDGKYVLDGQWKPKFANLSTTSTVNSYTHDLSSYLPNDNQAYEISVYLDGVYGSQNAEFAVGTVPNPVLNHFVGGGNIQLYSRVTAYSRTGCIAGILPVGVGANAKRTIYSQISGTDLNSSHIYVYAYRRIGTNE